jgi:hypothetical protein
MGAWKEHTDQFVFMSVVTDLIQHEAAVWDCEPVVVAMVSSSLDLEMQLKTSLLLRARRITLHLPSRYGMDHW